MNLPVILRKFFRPEKSPATSLWKSFCWNVKNPKSKQIWNFFSSRIQADVPKATVPTITFTAKTCPICGKATRTLVRPPHVELDSEIGVECGCQGHIKYPSSIISFQGNFVREGHIIVESLRGLDGAPGRPPTE